MVEEKRIESKFYIDFQKLAPLTYEEQCRE